jgi:uncharacterized protein (DUF2147 family)
MEDKVQKFISFFALAFLATAVLTGCTETASSVQVKNAQNATVAQNNAAAKSAASHSADDGHNHGGAQDAVKRITIEEAKAAVEAGKALIVDVRPAEAYKTKHIKGSISMPDVATGYQSLPKDKQIITYCS